MHLIRHVFISRPTCKTREAEIQGSESKEEENFIWTPLHQDPFTSQLPASAGGNTYVWAPIPQVCFKNTIFFYLLCDTGAIDDDLVC